MRKSFQRILCFGSKTRASWTPVTSALERNGGFPLTKMPGSASVWEARQRLLDHLRLAHRDELLRLVTKRTGVFKGEGTKLCGAGIGPYFANFLASAPAAAARGKRAAPSLIVLPVTPTEFKSIAM